MPCSLVVSLLAPLVGLVPLKAAEQLEVSFDGVVIPVQISDLVDWARADGDANTELGIWLELMEPTSRQGMLELLKAPLITDRSMARQMLNSWAGRRLLDEIADLVQVDDDTVGVTVLNTLERLLNRQPQVSSLDLLEALPAKRVRLDLDGLVDAADHWRQQLEQQQALVRRLDRIPINGVSPAPSLATTSDAVVQPQQQLLPVAHRRRPLQLQLWRATEEQPREGERQQRTWIVLMPGLGGSPDHFR